METGVKTYANRSAKIAEIAQMKEDVQEIVGIMSSLKVSQLKQIVRDLINGKTIAEIREKYAPIRVTYRAIDTHTQQYPITYRAVT